MYVIYSHYLRGATVAKVIDCTNTTLRVQDLSGREGIIRPRRTPYGTPVSKLLFVPYHQLPKEP